MFLVFARARPVAEAETETVVDGVFEFLGLIVRREDDHGFLVFVEVGLKELAQDVEGYFVESQ